MEVRSTMPSKPIGRFWDTTNFKHSAYTYRDSAESRECILTGYVAPGRTNLVPSQRNIGKRSTVPHPHKLLRPTRMLPIGCQKKTMANEVEASRPYRLGVYVHDMNNKVRKNHNLE